MYEENRKILEERLKWYVTNEIDNENQIKESKNMRNLLKKYKIE